jgi:8-oxo-dGTP diphosphatase
MEHVCYDGYMPHIHDQPGQYDHTVTAYIVRTEGDEPRMLMHMHRKLHILLPVGGHIEIDETPWQAAAHEIAEESGYALSELTILQPRDRIRELHGVLLHPQPVVVNTHNITDVHAHSDVGYALVAEGEPTGQPDEGESADIRWLTKAELQGFTSDVLRYNTLQTCEFIFDTALPSWEQIPASEFTLQSATELYAEINK